jgi:hypothetical protein
LRANGDPLSLLLTFLNIAFCHGFQFK